MVGVMLGVGKGNLRLVIRGEDWGFKADLTLVGRQGGDKGETRERLL